MCVVGSCRSCDLLREKLDEACQVITRAEDILANVNRKKSKLYDGISSLHDRYLSFEENLCTFEGVKLVGEEVLFESGKHHVKLRDRFHVASERIVPLETQRSLLEANYEVFLRENHVLRA
ncbi:unnamed protein product [Lactuca virosa]|uniref:Uncharacterized protein n=1 Tax=Lactuca virosa TaxID=75947 RepID=A0AAU9P1I5_9ASTR|nr:unnamed protein product [Lactuca virosa]